MADEELRPIDADHFWIGEVMVDLNQLRHEEQVAGKDYDRFTNMQCHGIGQALGALSIYAKNLYRGEEVSASAVKYSLRRLNSLGLHTGYVSKEER